VRVMNMKADDRVSAVALVVESGEEPTEGEAEESTLPLAEAATDGAEAATDGAAPHAAKPAKGHRKS
ncbi:MAG: hypothetical protein M3R23_07850, partial [Actinomycetota bacterium]|nr:hypothetical protein [Actinomycetota bacterium]